LRFVSLWLPVIAYTTFIFWLSSAPRALPAILRWPGGDKVVHLGEYTPLGVLLLRAFGRSQFPAAPATGAVIGMLDEMFQGFVPTRHVSHWDFLADLGGIAIGLAIYRWKRAKTP
jgi:VanZ family protein